jgi:membrane protein
MPAPWTLAKPWLKMLATAVSVWLEHNPFVHAGALAFFTLFSLAPTLIIAVAIIGIVLGEGAAQGEIVDQLKDTMGVDAAAAVEQAVLMSRIQTTGLLPTVIGIGALLIGATTAFGQLRYSLNVLWGVRPDPRGNLVRGSLWELAKGRVLALAAVLMIGLALLLFFVSITAVQAIAAAVDPQWLPALTAGRLVGGLQTVAALAVMALFVAALFKVLPDVVLTWRDVALGAVVTALLLSFGRYGISLYLSKTAVASTYGAAASLLVVLFWVYFSALILLFGAAFTRAHLTARGRPIVPQPGAVRVVQSLV